VYLILKTLVTNINPQLGFILAQLAQLGMDEGAPMCKGHLDDEIEFIWKIWGVGHSIAPRVKEAMHILYIKANMVSICLW